METPQEVKLAISRDEESLLRRLTEQGQTLTVSIYLYGKGSECVVRPKQDESIELELDEMMCNLIWNNEQATYLFNRITFNIKQESGQLSGSIIYLSDDFENSLDVDSPPIMQILGKATGLPVDDGSEDESSWLLDLSIERKPCGGVTMDTLNLRDPDDKSISVKAAARQEIQAALTTHLDSLIADEGRFSGVSDRLGWSLDLRDSEGQLDESAELNIIFTFSD